MLDIDMKMFSPVLINQYRLIIFEKKFQTNCCGHRVTVNKRVVNKGISKPINYIKHKDFINNETSKILPIFKLLVVIVMLAHTIWHIDAAASVTPVSPNKRGKDTFELLKNENSEPKLFELFKKQGKTARSTFFPKKNAYRNDYNHKDESGLISLPEPDKVFDKSGYVADDGQQYDRAELALAAYAASSLQAFNKSNSHMYSNNCPKECTCLNDYFDCAKKHFEHVPAVPDYVQVLDFSGNKLTDETILELRNLTELHKLNLKRNQLENVPKFHGLISLKHLNLASNRIQQLSKEAFEALPSLKSLDVTKNLLHAIHHNVFPEHNRLTHLILNGNKISNIDENAFDNLSNLVDLELNSNKLRILPAGIFGNLTKLKKLALNNNNLEINWSTFRGLHSLQKLQLKSNKIRALQDGVFHVMRSIETIELDHNAITSLSRQGLYNLTKLHHLSLSNNTISRIELDTFEFTQSLTSLDLSYNNITEFKPQHLECLQHLLRLNLGHNKIQYLMENTFDCVKNLEDLNFRRNKLSWVIEDQFAAPPFKSLHNLKRLDLYGNNLKQITTKSLSGLNKLELLNLGGNAIASVQANAFEHMAQLQKLIFKSINFICDCEIVWFRRWLLTNFDGNPQIQKNAVCGYPEHLLDRELITLPKAELVCADTPKPKIIKEPSNQLAVKGANITMECFASSPAAASLAATDELKVIWRHDNQNLRTRYPGSSIIKGSIHGLHSHSNTETQIHHDQSKNLTNVIGLLRLYNVSYENAGKYQCVVSNAFGSTYSQKFKISIGIHPKFLQIPKNLTIDSGETARLVCSATGDPTPEIALQKFGGSDFPAATERRLQVIREENAFVITNAKASDTGIYTCTADSAAGEIKVNATLTVNDKPQPSIPKVHKESVLGKVTALECLNDDAVELIDPHREWFKDNKPFHASSTSSSKRYYFTNEKEYLIIRDTQSVDAGQYRCEIMDSSKTFILLSELVVVKEDFNQNVIIIGVVLVTIACILVGSLIIWTIMFLQKKKMISNDEGETTRMEYIHNESDRQINVGSRGSALDQTQLTSLNQTDLRQIRSYSQRPRSLADLDFRNLSESARYQHNRLLTNGAANYESVDVGITLQYLDNNSTDDLQQQQDQLSSKDSGTGSDAAAKRSIDDFAVALIPKQSSSSARDVNERMGINSDSNINFDYEIPECDTELCDTHHYECDPDENDRFLHSAVPQHVDDNFRTTTQKSQSSAVGTSRTERPGDYEKNCSKMHSQEVDI